MQSKISEKKHNNLAVKYFYTRKKYIFTCNFSQKHKNGFGKHTIIYADTKIKLFFAPNFSRTHKKFLFLHSECKYKDERPVILSVQHSLHHDFCYPGSVHFIYPRARSCRCQELCKSKEDPRICLFPDDFLLHHQGCVSTTAPHRSP